MTEPRRPLAVIIGIADDALPRLRLATPVRDAEALAALLEHHHGYAIRLVRPAPEASRAPCASIPIGSTPGSTRRRQVVELHRQLAHACLEAVEDREPPTGPARWPADGSATPDQSTARRDVLRDRRTRRGD